MTARRQRVANLILATIRLDDFPVQQVKGIVTRDYPEMTPENHYRQAEKHRDGFNEERKWRKALFDAMEEEPKDPGLRKPPAFGKGQMAQAMFQAWNRSIDREELHEKFFHHQRDQMKHKVEKARQKGAVQPKAG